MLKKAPIFCLLSLMLAGCGTNGSSNVVTVSGGTGGTSTNYTGQAQGVYSGTASSGYSFSTIALPNDKFYGIYGTISGTLFTVYGMVTGQGTSGNGTYTANVTDFLYTGQTFSDSLTATDVPGSSVNGTMTENGTPITFNGTALSTSLFNYNTPALLSAVSGTWTGSLLNGAPATVTISSSGSVGGISQGCSFSGNVAADNSNKNFYDVTLTFGASPCLFPNQTASGIGVEYLLSDGKTNQLLAAVTSGTSAGTVFFAQRSTVTPSITVSCANTSINANGTSQCTATISNLSSTVANWQVNTITGGNSTVGTIDSNGLYRAPAVVPTTNNGVVTITAVAQAQSSLTATASITILPPAVISAVTCVDSITLLASQTAASGKSLVCTPTVSGGGTIAVDWFINNSATCSSTLGAQNGNVNGTFPYGTIALAGNQMNFTAPLIPPPGAAIAITARSQVDHTQTLCVPVTLTFGTAALQGSFAFSMSGRVASGNTFRARAGIFTADGSGHIVSGTEDINPQPPLIPQTPIPFSGTYSIGQDGRGTMQFCEPSTSNSCTTPSSQFRIVVVSAKQAQVIDFPSTVSASTESGEMIQQDISSFSAASLLGTYTFNFAGVSSASAAQSQVGEFTANGSNGITSGQVDVNAGGGQSILATSSYTVSSNGRGAATIITSSGTFKFSFYMISANRAKFIESDSFPILVGDAFKQQSIVLWGANSLTGPFVVQTAGSSAGGGVTDLVSFTSNGSGGVVAGSAMVDDNNAGTVTSLSSLGGSYTFDVSGNGRGTLTIGAHTYVFYMISTGSAVIQETTAGIVAHGSLVQPQGGPFTLASLQTSYALSLSGVNSAGSEEDFVGQLKTNGAGIVTAGSLDINNFGAIQTAVSNIGTYATVATNGRTTMTLTQPQNLVLYFVSPTQIFAMVGVDANKTVASGSLYKLF